MRDTDYESSIWKLKLAVKETDVLKADKCLTEILKITENQDSVPSNLVKEFFGYLLDATNLSELKDKERKDKANVIYEACIKRFGKDGYAFRSFKKMITRCIVSYFGLHSKPEKEFLMQLFYGIIQKHTKANKKYSNYKMMALAGYLTEQIGYGLTEKKNPTNHDYYEATRNAINKKSVK